MDEEEKKQKQREVAEKRKAKAAKRKGTGALSGGGFNPVQAPKPEEGADKRKNSNDQDAQVDKGQKTDKCIKQKS